VYPVKEKKNDKQPDFTLSIEWPGEQKKEFVPTSKNVQVEDLG
jgi:hypothetical protein